MPEDKVFAESIAVPLADLLVVLRYMETKSWPDQRVMNALDRLGDITLKARMTQYNDGTQRDQDA